MSHPYQTYYNRLNQLERDGLSRFLRGGYKGLEKESLRVSPNGFIAQADHPQPLGAALTHPYITTDYSEALLEFVSPPYMDALEANQFLYQIHQFVFENLQHDEMLWATSMPCAVRGDESVRIAQYGTSNAAQFKEVYRRGLGHRYGRVMQTIAGVHFNYSVPARFWPIYQFVEQNDERPSDFRTAVYMGLVRNVLRYDWLLFYLFGSSPAVCHTFLKGRDHPFDWFDKGHTLYKPYATTLRMSDIGYQNKLPPEFVVSLNSLTEYVAGLTYAIETPYPPYQEIGVLVEGEYQQLNDHFLQIENEYYSAMRPKQSVHAGERPALALQRRGVAYVELRAIDVNPFTPTGVSPDQLHFLEMFLLFCLLLPSPPLDTAERQRLRANETAVALDGRRPGKMLLAAEGERSLAEWGTELVEQMRPLAHMLDGDEEGGGVYTAVLSKLQERLTDPTQTPSARVLAEMRQEGESFHAFARRWSQQHEQTFRAAPLQGERRQFFQNLAAESHRAWQAQEAEPQPPFAQYLRDYFTRR